MAASGPRYDDLGALYVNCTLKPSPQLSHTQGLIDVSAGIMRKQGVRVEMIRAADHDIATGVWPDMTEHGAAADAWPQLYPKVLAADILVIAEPDRPGQDQDVGGQHLVIQLRPGIGGGAVLGHIRPHPGRDVMVGGPDRLHPHALLAHDRGAHIDQALGVAQLR
jgi:hypothetical protein